MTLSRLTAFDSSSLNSLYIIQIPGASLFLNWTQVSYMSGEWEVQKVDFVLGEPFLYWFGHVFWIIVLCTYHFFHVYWLNPAVLYLKHPWKQFRVICNLINFSWHLEGKRTHKSYSCLFAHIHVTWFCYYQKAQCKFHLIKACCELRSQGSLWS